MRMQQTRNNVLLKSKNDLHLYFFVCKLLKCIYLILSRLIPAELPNGFIRRSFMRVAAHYFVALHLVFGLYIIYKV